MTELKPSDIVGKKKVDAVRLIEGKGLCCRITSEDGKYFVMTADFHPDRFNLDVKDGVVVNAALG